VFTTEIKVMGRPGGPAPLRVGIIGYDGVNSLDLSGPLETLAAAQTTAVLLERKPCYRTILIGVKGKSFVSQSQVAFQAEATLLKTPELDTVIIPGGVGMASIETRRLISDWLTANISRIRRVVCVSNGVYPLAESRLLDGRRIATHWRTAQDLAVRFPNLRVDASASFLRDGPFSTCGGGTAAMEVTLALIEEDYGARVALAVAREMVVRLRPGGENGSALDPSQFETAPSDRLAELPAWIAAHLNDDLSVEVLASRTCLCPRHFSRLFKRFFKATPATFVERIRLEEARRCLASSRHSIASVASAVGFASADTFRRAFERRHGVSPVTFRRKSRLGDGDVTAFSAEPLAA
jgi:transcriptional regulator GlxA family with amidase domain